MNWDMLCKPKEIGEGVGLKRAGMMNKALLEKLAWRVLKDEGYLVLSAKGKKLGTKRGWVFV